MDWRLELVAGAGLDGVWWAYNEVPYSSYYRNASVGFEALKCRLNEAPTSSKSSKGATGANLH